MKKILFLFIAAILTTLQAGNYKEPPAEISKLLDVPADEYLSPIRDTQLAIKLAYEPFTSLATLSEDFLELAGSRINPVTSSVVIKNRFLYLKLYNHLTNSTTTIAESGADYILDYSISPSKHYLAIKMQKLDGIYLTVYDLVKSKSVYLSSFKLNNVLDDLAVQWVKNDGLMLMTVPEKRAPLKIRSAEFIVPRTEETSGQSAKLRTFQSLLKDEYDRYLFEHFFTSQPVLLSLPQGKIEKIGKPDIYTVFEMSPDGKFINAKRINKPYSFAVPYYRFGYTREILNTKGKMVKELTTKPVQEEIPVDGVEQGARYFSWLPGRPAEICWLEAQDKGDPEITVPERDWLYSSAAPFVNSSVKIKCKERLSDLEFFADGQRVMVTEYDNNKEWNRCYIADLNGKAVSQEVYSLSENDKYAHPGSLLKSFDLSGQEIILEKNGFCFYKNPGYTPNGTKPALDAINFTTSEKKRVFQSDSTAYERISNFWGKSNDSLVVASESPEQPLNYYICDLKTGKRIALTNNQDKQPQLRSIKKELVNYFRADSLKLNGSLYLPPDYEPGKKYPLVIWAYPREFTDAALAGQVSGTANNYLRFGGWSPLYLTLLGYVVLDNASMPVVGNVKERNDNFITQIVDNAKAAIDYLDKRGIIDPNKVAVGGHSYGAFMTAVLLAESNLFKAGIAQSGAYNRTLTPFGFQSEKRSYWQAKEFYNRVSPFNNVEKLKSPLLLIHGEKDSNPGTYPIQSERMYAAIKGNGGTARLVILPYEDHGYEAKESVKQMIAETVEWLDKYLK